MIKLVQHISSLLQAAYPPDEAKALAWWIAEETTGLSRTQLLSGCKDTTFSPHMQTIVERLLHFEPIQYIFGHTLWNGLDLIVTPDTLIPRPETAELVELINKQMVNDKMVNVLDIGTGSGCIAISLKKRHPHWQVTGIDISQQAIEIAKQNAIRNNVDVNFLQTDIFNHTSYIIHQTYNIVLSNPPYICEREKSTMRPNVLNYEPHTALFVPDNDPLLFYRRIAALHLGKELFFEINEAYALEIQDLLLQLGYTDIQTYNDSYDKPRFIQVHDQTRHP